MDNVVSVLIWRGHAQGMDSGWIKDGTDVGINFLVLQLRKIGAVVLEHFAAGGVDVEARGVRPHTGSAEQGQSLTESDVQKACAFEVDAFCQACEILSGFSDSFCGEGLV